MTTEIRLLGPIEVVLDGEHVDVGHARQLSVLAALAVQPGRATSVDQLVDRVWGEHPPQRAREALQSYCSRLRKVLAPTRIGIAHRPAGYVLSAEPDMVDLHRFRRLVTVATQALEDDAAYVLLASALGLWRGQALETVDTPWALGVRNELAAERFAARLDRAEIGLRLGRHAELVGGLTAAVAEHPWDERVAALTMLAMHLCGRTADALEVYQEVRRRLADELGTDPATSLRVLHQRILADDPTLATAAEPRTERTAPTIRPTVPVSPAVVPRQLPAAPARFTGRSAEIVELTNLMAAENDDQPTVTTITAGGGMGKTWLALQWANAHASGYPDGQLYVDLHGFDPGTRPTPSLLALRTFAQALGVPPAEIPVDLDSLAGLYRSLVSARRMLVVLDNARDSSSVAPLLPGSSGTSVLVTSRRRLTGLVVAHGMRTLSLDLMPETDARKALVRHLRRAPTADERLAVQELVDLCAGLPLAISIAGARAAALAPGEAVVRYAAELGDAASRLDALDAGDLSTNLRKVLASSLSALTNEAAEVFALLGRAPGPSLSLSAVASLAGARPEAVRPVLGELIGAHLVQRVGSHRFGMHDLIRLYAAERTRSRPAAADAERRLLDHYLHSGHCAALVLSPHRAPLDLAEPAEGVTVDESADVEAAMAWFSAEDRSLVATIQRAGADGQHRYAVGLPWTLATYYDRRGHWAEWAAVQEVAVESAEELGDPAAEAQARRLLANAYSNLRRYDDAQEQLARTLELFEAAGDIDGRAHVHFDIALLHDRHGEFTEALRHAEESLAWYRLVPYDLGVAVALNAVGWYNCELGNFDQAVDRCRESLKLATGIDSDYGRSNALDSLGYAYHHLGQYPEAVDAYRQAIELFRSMGDRHGEAIALDHLGDSRSAGGDASGAREAWHQAATTLEELRHPDAEAVLAKLAP